jgi:hypothetical protein
MNPTAIYSKSGKGVQEASGKTSQLSRADRAILSAFDGRLTLADVSERVGKPFDAKFEQIVTQLEKDGFIREVSSGASAPAAKPAAAKPAPAAAPAKPAAAKGEDLDFTIAIPASPTPKAPPKAATMAPAAAARAETEKKAQEDNMTRARREAEERQQKERDKIKAEAEAKLRVETEAKMRSEAAQKAKADAEKAKKDAEDKIRAEAEAKVKAAREAAVKAALEAERKVKEEAERIRREAEEKARKEAAELQRKLDEERRAREEAERARQEAERKVREEAERVRKEAEEKARREAAELQRKLDEERRAREEAERRAREEAERAKKEAERARQEAERAKQEAERAAREEAERARKEAERAAREEAEREKKEAERSKKEADRAAREDAEREARESAERSRREDEERRTESDRAAEEADRLARELVEAQAAQVREQEAAKPKAPAAKAGGGFDSLLADLDSFSDREDEDKKAKEEADKKAKEEKARRQREDAEAKAREQAENKKREAEERQRKEEQERAKEEAKRKAREEEEARERKEEEERKAEEKKRKRREEALAKEASSEKSADIGVSDDDLDMDDVKADEQAVSKESRKAAREREREAKEREKEARERAREREREAKRASATPAAPPVGGYRPLRRKRSWGKPIALTLFVLLAAGLGALHLMPINTEEYDKAASEAIGKPVRIGVAYLSLYNGVVLKLQNIQIGETRIASGRAYPEIGSLFNEKKTFSRIELDGVTLPQAGIGEALNVQLRNDKFYVARLIVRQLKLSGALPVPPLDTEVTVGPQGSVALIEVRGPDSLAARLTPAGTDITFEATASGFTIPFLPDVTLSTFAMKGRATRDAARIESWGGATMGGAVNGSANVKWAGNNWNVDGTMTLRGINAAVFAPALLSEGNAEGTARFSMSDPDPSKFKDRGRVEGTFSVNKGVLGSFDLSRAILTGGRQATGRTPFTEMNGSGVFDRGTVALRNVTFGAGAMNATANADISPEGALSGRIVADIRTAAQNLRATINVGGTVGEPQVK